jgi:hypothetical protein
MLTLVKFRCELRKVLMLVLGSECFKPNNTEAGTRSLTIIRHVMWEDQVQPAPNVTTPTHHPFPPLQAPACRLGKASG